jgi:hypothetical protein
MDNLGTTPPYICRPTPDKSVIYTVYQLLLNLY